MIRWFVMPMDTQGIHRGPKYLKWRFNPSGLDVPWHGCDFGKHAMWVGWADVTLAQAASVAANPDVHLLPALLGSAGLSALSAALEGDGIPAQRLTVGMTPQGVARHLCQIAQYAQSLHGELDARMDQDDTLDGPVSLANRARMLALAERRPLYSRLVTRLLDGGITTRQVIAATADDFTGPIQLGAVTI